MDPDPLLDDARRRLALWSPAERAVVDAWIERSAAAQPDYAEQRARWIDVPRDVHAIVQTKDTVARLSNRMLYALLHDGLMAHSRLRPSTPPRT